MRIHRYLLFTAVIGAAAFAQGLQPAPRDRATVERPAQVGDATNAPQIRRRADGAVTSASGLTTRAYPGSKADAARAFLAERGDLLGDVNARSLRLIAARTLGSNAGRAFVRFQQQIGGIDVRGAQLVVQVTADNRVAGLQSRLEPSLRARSTEWPVGEPEARRIATEGMNPADGAPVRANRLYVVQDGEATPVWQILFRSGNPAGDWEVIVDATTGSVLEKQNLRQGADVFGYAYPSNPVKGDLQRVTLPNLASDTRLLSAQTKIYTYFPALRGQVPVNTVVQGASRTDGNFLFTPDDARFSEVQLYWGMETAAARFAALGFWGFDEPLPGTVFWQDYDKDQKRFVGANNAYYTPEGFGEGKPGMFFYLTGRNGDTSLDTDVIFHEYTHAIVAELVGPYQSLSFKALNEGTADYFSSSFLNDPVLAEYAAKIFASRIPFLRRADNSNRWPYNVVGEVHADGNIWSGALWDVRQRFGATVADDIAVNAVAALTPAADFFDAAVAAIDAADYLYGSKTASAVEEIMTARGLYTEEAKTSARAVVLASGKHGQGTVPAAKPGFVLVAAQQYRVEVPNRATRLTIRLQSDAPARFYIRYRVPITIEDGRIVAEQLSETGTDVTGSLTLRNTPELQAGVYYLAVVNTTTSPARYDLQADTDGDPAAMPAITFLNSGDTGTGSAPAGPFLASRQFAVQVPAGTRALAIRLEGDRDVDLYVRYNQPIVITGTGFPQADFVSDSDQSREDMRLTVPDGSPVPEGVYVIGVYNYSEETARYTVRVALEN